MDGRADKAPRHSFEEHRGELELRVDAPTLPALFAEAARGLAEAMRPTERGARCEEEVVVAASDRDALLAAWLNEIVFHSEVARAVFTEFEIRELDEQRIVASIRGSRVARLRNPVKAATYHRLRIVATPDGFTATVVLDV